MFRVAIIKILHETRITKCETRCVYPEVGHDASIAGLASRMAQQMRFSPLTSLHCSLPPPPNCDETWQPAGTLVP